MSMKTVRVLQGFSVCHLGIWYNQGQEITVPEDVEFHATRPKYDTQGKLLGEEDVSPVETIMPEASAEAR